MLPFCCIMTLPKTILVPIDFGESSEHAVTYAAELAKALGAEIVLMHAWDVPVVGFPDGAFVATPELATQVTEAAQHGLDRARMLIDGQGVTIRGVLKQGPTDAMILDAAKEESAGMIVMGTHGRTGIQRVLLGSVAEKLVRTSPIPVLTVHPDIPAAA